jgi:deoxyadenosine/deoxycytidine kinase
MLEDELVIYQELLSNMLEHIKVPELLIYLDVSVETALERIRKRSRSTEGEMIPRDYLIDLKRNYEEWYDAFDLCPKVRINLDAKGVLDVAKKESILKSIRKYIVVKK